MKRIVADPSKCLACRACELACALAHVETDDLVEAILHRGARPRIYVESAGGLAVPLQCRHCEDAPCVRVCPSAALSRAGEAEPVLASQDRCIGCGFCVEACPFGVIRLAPEGRVIIKCDLCAERLAEGLEPACVSSCPVGAIAFDRPEEESGRKRARLALRLASGETC